MNNKTVRHLGASVASLFALAGLAYCAPSNWMILLLPMSLLVLAAPLVHRASLAPQLLVRAIWWANLALGFVLSVTGHIHREELGGLVMSVGCSAALLLAGRKTLAALGTSIAVPPALRGMLTLLLVFALADAQTFLLFGSVDLFRDRTAWFFLAFGITYIVGFVGLYRLRLWGALVNIAASILVVLTMYFTSIVTGELRSFLAVLAVVHVLVAMPVAISVLRGRDLPSLLSARVRGFLADGTVVALVVIAVLKVVVS